MAFCWIGPPGSPKNGTAWPPNGFCTVSTVLMLTTAGLTRATAATNGLRAPAGAGAATGAPAASTACGRTYDATVAPAPPLSAAISTTITTNSMCRNLTISSFPLGIRRIEAARRGPDPLRRPPPSINTVRLRGDVPRVDVTRPACRCADGEPAPRAGLEGQDRLRRRLLRELARGGHAEHAGKGQLGLRRVAAGVLAERRFIAEHVQEVVHDLKRERDVGAVSRERVQGRVRCAAEQAADAETGLDQRAGLEPVDLSNVAG